MNDLKAVVNIILDKELILNQHASYAVPKGSSQLQEKKNL